MSGEFYSGLRWQDTGTAFVTWSRFNTAMHDWIVTHLTGYMPVESRTMTRDQLKECLCGMLDVVAEHDDPCDYQVSQCMQVIEGVTRALARPAPVEYWEKRVAA